jgi:hypothetical protein
MAAAAAAAPQPAIPHQTQKQNNTSDNSPGGSLINITFDSLGKFLFDSIFGSDIQSFENDVVDWLERGALIIFGGIIIIVGLVIFSRPAEHKQQTQAAALPEGGETAPVGKQKPDATKGAVKKAARTGEEAAEVAIVA